MKAPIKDFKCKKFPEGNITQWFGENPVLYGKFCQENMCLAGHNGIDIVSPWGTPILCVETGQVADVKENPDGYGKYIRITTKTNREWTYGHLSRIDVKIGQEVGDSEQIGLMGNTGFVVSGATPYWQYNPYAGTHLHLGLRLIKYTPNGWSYNYSLPKFTVLNYTNGYFGSVDYQKELEEASVANEKPEDDSVIIPLQLTVISLLNQIISILRR
jgi:murein DD-endopeptidase MepM/ murein hydrolase activator NlpD